MTRYAMTGAVLAVGLLAGCEAAEPVARSLAWPPILPPQADVEALADPAPFAAEFLEAPFSEGVVSVVTDGGDDEMATYRLIPCQDGRAICLGGRAGQLSVAGETYVVSGLPGGRSFHLETGGGGFMTIGETRQPVAWEHFPKLDI